MRDNKGKVWFEITPFTTQHEVKRLDYPHCIRTVKSSSLSTTLHSHYRLATGGARADGNGEVCLRQEDTWRTQRLGVGATTEQPTMARCCFDEWTDHYSLDIATKNENLPTHYAGDEDAYRRLGRMPRNRTPVSGYPFLISLIDNSVYV